jgi:hypothetical protein
MKVVNTLCDTCSGQGKIYEWGKLEGTDLPTRILKSTCEVCSGTGSIPYVMFTLVEAKVILEKCGLEEHYETNN